VLPLLVLLLLPLLVLLLLLCGPLSLSMNWRTTALNSWD